jgi:RNA polymerase subunit RPABC4/transcription elongation factor Spt4
MICQKCHIVYDEGKKFCRNCGSSLSATEKPSSINGSNPSIVERIRIIRVCPRCHLSFEVGNYCRICGSFLKKEIVSQGRERIPDKRTIKSLSSEWLRLMKKKSEFEICLGNLEEQRGGLSDDAFNLTFLRYQVQVESLSSRLREIEAELESFRTIVPKQISLLEDESGVIQKRFEEIRSLYQFGAITRTDYFTEKDWIKKERNLIEKRLRQYRRAISLLSIPLGEGSLSPLKIKNLRQYRFSLIAGGMMILIGLGAYFLWARNFKISHSQGSTNITQTKTSAQAGLPKSMPEVREDAKIKSLFEKIRQSNLEKRIDLFMSCYSADFKDRNGKRSETLETWDNFDYLDLSYELKKLIVTTQTAQVRVEWRINISPKNEGTPQMTTSLLEVTLKKEDGHWKIGEIKPVS